MNNSAGQVRYDITANTDDFLKQLRAAGKAIDEFGDKISEADKKLIQDWNNLADEMKAAIEKGVRWSMEPIDEFIKSTASQISAMTSSIANVGVSAFQVASGAAATAISTLAAQGISGADSLSKYNAQIIGMANSTQDANSAMSTAVTFFKQNPFQRFETVEAVKNLMMYDKSIANAADGSKKLAKELDMLGVASLATNVPIAELASKWGEVSSQARVSKGQFEELAMRVPALYDAVGKKMGKSAGEVSDALNRVGIDTNIVREAMEELYGLDTTKLNLPQSSKEFKEYFNSLTGPARQSAEAYLAFGNTLARQTDRVKGRLADMAQALVGYELTAEGGFKALEGGIFQSVINLEKAFADILASSTETGQKLRSALAKIGNAIAPYIDKLAEKLPSIIDKVVNLLDKLGDHIEFLLPILAGALTLFGGLASNVPVLGPAISTVTSPLKNLLGVFLKLNPALQIIYSILGAGVFKALREGKLNGPLESIFKSVSRIAKALEPVVKQLLDIFAKIGETVVVTSLNALATALEGLASILEKLPPEVITSIVVAILGFRAVTTIWTPIAETVKRFDTLKNALTKMFNAKSEVLGGIDKIKNALSGVSSTAESAGKMAEKSGKASGSMQTAAASMTKGQQAMKTMRSAILNIILIAGAIAAMGVALRIAYDAIPDNLLGLVAKLAVVGLAVVEFGALAIAADKLKIGIKPIAEMAGIAVVIALLAGSMWAINKAIPDNFMIIVPKIIVLGVAVAAIGALAFVGGIAFAEIALGLVAILGIAVDIGAVAVALGLLNKKIPNNVGKFYEKMAAMGVAIGGFGAIATAVGALMMTGFGAAALGAGLAAIAGIAGDIIICAKAIDSINKKVPKNIDATKKKINLLFDVLTHMANNSFGNLIENIANSLRIEPLVKIAEAYRKVAMNLDSIGKVQLKKQDILNKVNLIYEVIKIVSDTGEESVAGLIEKATKNFYQAIDVNIISKIVETYHSIATKLSEIQTVELDSASLVSRVILLKETIEYIGSTKEGSVAKAIENTAKTFLASIDTNIISNMVSTYKDIAQKLSEIQGIELNETGIKKKIELLGGVVKTVGEAKIADGESLWDVALKGIEVAINSKTVENIGKILEVYTQITNSIKTINKKFTFSEEDVENISTKIGVLGDIVQIVGGTKGTGKGLVGAIGGFFVGGQITPEQVDSVIRIIEKFSEISKVLNEFKGLKDKDGAITSIEGIRDAIYAAGQINEVKGIENKEGVVHRTMSILYKMNEFVGLLNSIPDINESKIENMQNIRHAIWEAGQINEGVGDIAGKEGILNMTMSILYKMNEFVGLLNSIPTIVEEKLTNMKNIRHAVWEAGQVSENVGEIGNKEFIVGMAMSILYKMNEFVGVLNSLPTLSDEQNTNMLKIRHAIWEACQINENVGDIGNKESIVESAKNIISKMKEFATSLTGVTSIEDEQVTNMLKVRHAIYEACQINESVGDLENKLQIVTQATSIVNEMKKFAAALNDLPGVDGDKSGLVSQFVQIINTSISNLISDISSKIPSFSTLGQQIGDALVMGVNSTIMKLSQAGTQLISLFITGIRSKYSEISRAGADAQGAFWNAVQPRLKDEYHQGRALIGNFINGINSRNGEFYHSGRNAVQGFVNGANSLNVYTTGGRIASNFLAGLKKAAGERSPWKTTTQSGIYAVQGLIDGIDKMKDKLVFSATSLSESVVDALSLDNISSSLGFDSLGNMSMNISGQGQGGTLGGVNSKSNTINIYNNNYAQTDFNQMSRDIMFNINRL